MADSVISTQEERLAQATTPRERALALIELVDLLAHRDPARARQLGDSALGAALAADDSWLEARARLSRANALLGAADVGRVLDEMQTAMRSFEALGDRRARAFLQGAGPAAIGAIFGSAVSLTREIAHPWQYLVLAGALVLLFPLRRGVVLTLLAAAAVGVIIALAAGTVAP